MERQVIMCENDYIDNVENENNADNSPSETDERDCHTTNQTPIALREVRVAELNDEQLEKEDRNAFFRRQLVYSLFGLFLSPFFGIGFILSLMGLIGSLRLKKGSNSTILHWAFVIAVVGIIVNVAVFFILATYIRNAPAFPPQIDY